jgi:Membrane domain of glycerophosphoryl diester phosphodiesterase
VTLISGLLAMVCVLPGLMVFIGAAASAKGNEPPVGLLVVGGILSFIGVLGAIYLTIAWVFALPLVADKLIPFWPAMKLSRRIVSMHWWQVFGVVFLSGLIMVGFMIVGVGIIVAIIAAASSSQNSGLAVSLGLLVGLVMAFGFFSLLPLIFGSLCVAYEDIFGQPRAE